MNGAVHEPMRLIITGVKYGKSCVVEEVDCTPQSMDLSTLLVARLPVANLPPRPPGKGEFIEIPVAPGEMIWFRVRFPANQVRRVHHTDTIDCHTVVSGWIELLLDDGAHQAQPRRQRDGDRCRPRLADRPGGLRRLDAQLRHAEAGELALEHADHAFLHDACNETAVAAEDLAADVPARPARPGAVRRVEQPVVDAEIVMEPDRVVQARFLHRRVEPADGVRQRRGV
jgi:hypothetical protein